MFERLNPDSSYQVSLHMIDVMRDYKCDNALSSSTNNRLKLKLAQYTSIYKGA
jgi:hypothetical protein